MPIQQPKKLINQISTEVKNLSVSEIQPLQRLVKWENGVPVATSERVPIKKEDIAVILGQALVAPFNRGSVHERVEEDSMTNIEVMAHSLARLAAFGDSRAIEIILDRLLGKPKQQTENVNMKMTYQDFLDSINKTENENASRQGNIKDVTPVEPYSDGDPSEAFS